MFLLYGDEKEKEKMEMEIEKRYIAQQDSSGREGGSTALIWELRLEKEKGKEWAFEKEF